jgi:hypothetical protein
MTDEEIKKRGEIYLQLIEFSPFQYLVEEMREKSASIGETIVNDLTPGKDCLWDKGKRAGIEDVINTPLNAVKEAEQLLNTENS